jgi:hypothetical protein
VLNREFSRLVQVVKAEFSYSESMGRFSLSAHARGSQILGMSEDLQRYMGFDLSTVLLDPQILGMSEDLQRYMGFDLSTVLLDPVSFGTMAKQAFDVNRGLNLVRLLRRCDAHDSRRHENATHSGVQRHRQARRIRASHLCSTALRTGRTTRVRFGRNRYK